MTGVGIVGLSRDMKGIGGSDGQESRLESPGRVYVKAF